MAISEVILLKTIVSSLILPLFLLLDPVQIARNTNSQAVDYSGRYVFKNYRKGKSGYECRVILTFAETLIAGDYSVTVKSTNCAINVVPDGV